MTRSIRRSAIAVGCAVIGACAAAAPAPAAQQVPFTIIEDVNLSEGGVDTFTATAPLCESGTFVDEWHTFAAVNSPTRLNLMGYATFACDDGSGTFVLHKHVHLVFAEDGSFTNTGPAVFAGGTGAYADIKGHGFDTGGGDGGNFATGVITGVLNVK